MPGPLLFFIFVIIIDLVLKSAKDKKKIEKAKQKRVQDLQNQPSKSRPMADLRKILEQEVEKERQKEMARRQERNIQNPTPKPSVKNTKQSTMEKELARKEISWEIRKDETTAEEKFKPVTTETKSNKKDLREDILRGIIFSEILSEPKSVQNQRRSP